MLESPRGLRVIVALAITLCIVASLTGARAGQGSSGLKFATVDRNRIANEAKSAIALKKELESKRDSFVVLARTISSYPLLEEKEQEELANLTALENNMAGNGLNDQQKKRLKQLKDQHKALFDEYEELRAKPQGAITPQQRERFDKLARSEAESQVRLQERQKRAQEDVNKQLEAVDAKMMTDFREALTKVAKEKGISVVFDSQIAPYADADLTSDVLKILNK